MKTGRGRRKVDSPRGGRFFTNKVVEPESALESNDTYFVKIMIEHGLGVALLPSWAVGQEILSGKLAQVRIKGHEMRRPFAMVSLKGAQSAPFARLCRIHARAKRKAPEAGVGLKAREKRK